MEARHNPLRRRLHHVPLPAHRFPPPPPAGPSLVSLPPTLRPAGKDSTRRRDARDIGMRWQLLCCDIHVPASGTLVSSSGEGGARAVLPVKQWTSPFSTKSERPPPEPIGSEPRSWDLLQSLVAVKPLTAVGGLQFWQSHVDQLTVLALRDRHAPIRLSAFSRGRLPQRRFRQAGDDGRQRAPRGRRHQGGVPSVGGRLGVQGSCSGCRCEPLLQPLHRLLCCPCHRNYISTQVGF